MRINLISVHGKCVSVGRWAAENHITTSLKCNLDATVYICTDAQAFLFFMYILDTKRGNDGNVFERYFLFTKRFYNF